MMTRFKNVIITMLVAIQLITFIGCKSNNTKSESKKDNKGASINSKKDNRMDNLEKKEYSLSDYLPFKPNVRMTYKGTGIEYAGKEVFIDFISENKMQVRENNGGTEVAKIIEVKDGEIRVIMAKEEFYFKDNLIQLLRDGKIDAGNLKNDVILKEPIKLGTKWNDYQGKERKITSLNASIEIPYGKFNALEVTTTGEGYVIKDYFVPTIGHVKKIYEAKDMRVITELIDVQQDVPFAQNIKLYYPKYYPDSNSEGLVYKNQNIELKTNGEIKDIFEKYFKEAQKDKDIMKIMSDNTKINYVYLNDEEKKVCIDFSKEFVTEMNAGTTKESLVLQSVTNTLGNYYGVEKVYISIDGNPYESGHILLNKNESFKVDESKAKEMEIEK
ncbi:GerMN domain-containing protein [Haloimpatiens lingqiaonensis]|uniref:GerMN domain-containing protein n=2 Tax=Haloimpatiens lingqiaonensis TaxID=1380675 RepID=UPI0010FE42E1